VRAKNADNVRTGTTWFSEDACLGSINRGGFWTQRKPIVAVVLRVRFLHDGRDFASMGVRTVQSGPRLLFAIQSLTNRGDFHISLDRPADGIVRASDLRLRLELHGNGVMSDEPGEGRFAFSAGQHSIVIHTRAAEFAGQPVEWMLGRKEHMVYLDARCYEGPRRAFDFSSRLAVQLAAGLELLRADQPATEARVRLHESPAAYEWRI